MTNTDIKRRTRDKLKTTRQDIIQNTNTNTNTKAIQRPSVRQKIMTNTEIKRRTRDKLKTTRQDKTTYKIQIQIQRQYNDQV